MIKNLLIGVVIVMMLIPSITFSTPTAKGHTAIVAAGQWLALVDAAKYAANWQTAAEYFKGAVTQEQLQQSLQAGRAPR